MRPTACFESFKAPTLGVDEEGWKKRQIAEISSIAMPRFLYFHALAAHSTSLLADFSLSLVEETISTASWFEMTSHNYKTNQIPIKGRH